MSSQQIETIKGLPRRMSPRQRSQFTTAELESCWDKLSLLHSVLLLRCIKWPSALMSEHAAALGVPVGTVKSRLNRARTALARELLKLELAQKVG